MIGSAGLTGKDLYRSSFINSRRTNPFMKGKWNKDWLVEQGKGLDNEVFEAWIKTILYLQRFAWRYHRRDCTESTCLGECVKKSGTEQTELRCYFHRKQAEFLSYNGVESWMITGRRFGKTEALVFYVVCDVLGYNPVSNRLIETPRRWFIVGLSYPLLRDEVIPCFKRLMPDNTVKISGDENLWDFSKADFIAKLHNGSEVIFKSCEAGWKKFQSVSLDGIAFDEEPDYEVYKEGKLRIKGGSKGIKIRGAMTPDPLRGLTWTYSKILKNEKRIRAGTLKVWTGSSYENKALPRTYMAEYEEELDDWEREVRIGGNYVIGRGRCVFDINTLISMREKCRDPVKVEKISGGILSVWEDPKKDHNYSFGVDVAEGLEHSDNSVVIILDRLNFSVVATYVGLIDPDILGQEIIALARWYNEAWIVCEANNHGLTTIKSMLRVGYANIYSEKSQVEIGYRTDTRRIGWFTNIVTRPILVDELRKVIRDKKINIYDVNIIDELGTFIVDNKGKQRGQSGHKDDRVMALGLAIQGHLRCPMSEYITREHKKPKPKLWWNEDDDYWTLDKPTWMSS